MSNRPVKDSNGRPQRRAESGSDGKSTLATEDLQMDRYANEWQIAEIHTSLIEAAAGDFATDQEVLALCKKWGVESR
jgi:RHH-type transcriptional regulator, rel operon repressor / antitoxin RelB